METVSVIIPVFNRRKMLPACQESIFRQTWRPIELIVVDNCSDDGSASFAEEWASGRQSEEFRISLLLEPRRGVCHARNRGLEAASGDYCIFFDSDDLLRPSTVAEAIAAFRKNHNTRIVCWKRAIHQLDGTLRIPPFHPGTPLECHLIHSLLATTAYMAPVFVFRQAGGWNVNLACWNDLELGVRILLHNLRLSSPDGLDGIVTGLDMPGCDIRCQPDSITGISFSEKAGDWELALDTIRDNPLTISSPYRELIQNMISYRETILAATYKKEGKSDLAAPLLEKALSKVSSSSMKRMLLRLAYHYTSFGGRGAWRIVRSAFTTSH